MARLDRPAAVAAVLATALATGALAGLATSAFIWLVDEGTRLVWVEVPASLEVDPFGSWYLFAVPLGAAVLVGLGQRFVGPHPMPLDRAIATWRSGRSLPPSTAPRTFANSAVILAAGGPVGFEAALTGIVGGAASWIGTRIGAAGRLVRQAWGAEAVDGLPRIVRHLPLWLAAIAGLVAYRSSPLGGIDLGFRYQRAGGSADPADLAAACGVAAALVIPVAWARAAVGRAETAPWSQRWPVRAALLGAIAFSVLALGSEYVLFSGQQAIQQLDGLDRGTLAYLVGAKWLALVVALAAGWRGGPIFPLYVASASTAVLAADALGARTDVVVIATLAGVGAVFVGGKVAPAFALTLYVAPLSYGVVIALGAVAGAAALALGAAAGIVPARAEPAGDEGQSVSSSRRRRLRMRSPVSPK